MKKHNFKSTLKPLLCMIHGVFMQSIAYYYDNVLTLKLDKTGDKDKKAKVCTDPQAGELRKGFTGLIFLRKL